MPVENTWDGWSEGESSRVLFVGPRNSSLLLPSERRTIKFERFFSGNDEPNLWESLKRCLRNFLPFTPIHPSVRVTLSKSSRHCESGLKARLYATPTILRENSCGYQVGPFIRVSRSYYRSFDLFSCRSKSFQFFYFNFSSGTSSIFMPRLLEPYYRRHWQFYIIYATECRRHWRVWRNSCSRSSVRDPNNSSP